MTNLIWCASLGLEQICETSEDPEERFGKSHARALVEILTSHCPCFSGPGYKKSRSKSPRVLAERKKAVAAAAAAAVAAAAAAKAKKMAPIRIKLGALGNKRKKSSSVSFTMLCNVYGCIDVLCGLLSVGACKCVRVDRFDCFPPSLPPSLSEW